MSIRLILKKVVELIPYSIGSKLVSVPFKYRLGSEYSSFSNKIEEYKSFDEKNKIEFIIKQFSEIFEFAKLHYPFYRDLYEKHKVFDLKIEKLEDIKKVPIIRKKDIRGFTSQFKGSLKLNTGGTSGEPFSFYVDNNAFAREWAHMHNIWKKKGYDQKKLKITLRGKDLGEKNIVYNPVHNEYIINTYKPLSSFKEDLVNLIKKRDIKYIHGYPSAILSFLKDLEIILNKKEIELFKSKILACFLGSEFPNPNLTKYLSGFWSFDYISWYGHSEMCILAYDENKDNKYTPYNTYGYTEEVEGRLIGTSYFNFDMPLIRYDTGDLVSGEYNNFGILENFTITQGREGEYIFDKNGNKIPLTALVFGRHHKAFNYVDFIQVKQNKETKEIIFYLITKSNDLPENSTLLNLESLELNYSICVKKEPFKTKAGKVKLKID